jgi:hypothetical protein
MTFRITRWSILQIVLGVLSGAVALMAETSGWAKDAWLVPFVAACLIPSVERSVSKTLAPGDRAISRAVVVVGVFVLAANIAVRYSGA